MSDKHTVETIRQRIRSLEAELDCGEYGSYAEMLIKDEIAMLDKILARLTKKKKSK